jgi:hypothetical protein
LSPFWQNCDKDVPLLWEQDVQVERSPHRELCNGTLTLMQAQKLDRALAGRRCGRGPARSTLLLPGAETAKRV